MRLSRRTLDAAAPGRGASPTVWRVLGVDPGTVVLGWGIVEGCGRGIEHVASGVVRARISTLFATCAVEIQIFWPDSR